jgi:carbonic anhydrase/SulP family sulfate permease
MGDQVQATSDAQHPLAVVLSCIDSRAPAELIFDVGLGDILSIRIAGNIISPEVLGSMEYACSFAGAKLILVMGHTRCGAVIKAVELAATSQTAAQTTGCQHIDPIINVIQESVSAFSSKPFQQLSEVEKDSFVNEVARGNVAHVTKLVFSQSTMLNQLHQEGRVSIVGAIYDVVTGDIEFLQ